MYKTPEIAILKPGRMLIFVFPFLFKQLQQAASFPVNNSFLREKKKEKKIQYWIDLCIFTMTRHHSHCLTAPEYE